ncbi:MAG TPA: ChbG/HpnK family deacetylase [Gaiellaceae bacterium]|jgi:predicted glycoside hydrolase/deacetylase ChbG (UPF0249 family)|nr:ChbG/HpnK family deacetylase [Gaiellaceae bacterium]
MRALIVNADDFGRSSGINAGVARAHDEGVVTSASAMVCWPAAVEAAALVLERPRLGVGLHIDLSEWEYDGRDWRPLYVRVEESGEEVEAEVTRQLQLFRELFGRDPTHLDSHQHRHRGEPLRSVLRNLGSRLGVPVRDLEPDVTYRGDFYGQTGRGEPLPAAIELAAFLRIVASLPDGVTELGCHPASEPETASSYAAERVAELHVLCDPRVREAVGAAGVELRSFA